MKNFLKANPVFSFVDQVADYWLQNISRIGPDFLPELQRNTQPVTPMLPNAPQSTEPAGAAANPSRNRIPCFHPRIKQTHMVPANLDEVNEALRDVEHEPDPPTVIERIWESASKAVLEYIIQEAGEEPTLLVADDSVSMVRVMYVIHVDVDPPSLGCIFLGHI